MEIWLGPPAGPESILAATIGPLSVNGTADASVALIDDDGVVSFASADLVLEDSLNNLVNLDALGTTIADLLAVGMTISSSDVPVTGGLWNLTTDPPASFSMALNQGTASLHDHTGFLASLADPTIIDFEASPVLVELADLLAFNINGTASDSLISINVPAIDLDVGAEALEIEGLLFIRLTGQINLVPVPEPSSVALLGMGAMGLGLAAVRRRRR